MGGDAKIYYVHFYELLLCILIACSKKSDFYFWQFDAQILVCIVVVLRMSYAFAELAALGSLLKQVILASCV